MKKSRRDSVHVFLILILALFIMIPTGFTHADNNRVSGSATSVLKCDGSAETREPTREEIESLDESIRKREEINRMYPGPDIPFDAPLLKVASIDNDGNITVEGGEVIKLEGIRCNPETVAYLRRMLLGDSDRIVYIPSSTKKEKPVPAYVWHASLSFMEDPELRDIIRGPSYAPINENALTSGWCVPIETAHHKYYERYVALSKMARRNDK